MAYRDLGVNEMASLSGELVETTSELNQAVTECPELAGVLPTL